eukprot:945059-Amphidinium_carterae.1
MFGVTLRRPFGVTGSKRPSGYGSYSADVISRRNRRGESIASELPPKTTESNPKLYRRISEERRAQKK